MKGVISLLNPHRGMAALKVDTGEYIPFGIIGPHSIKLGDVLSGRLEARGNERWFNETSREEMEVFIEALSCSRERAFEIIS